MPFNGSGTFTRLYDWTTDRDAGVKILASKMDDEFDGIATALSNVICKDGQTTITANIPLNNNKITGLAAGTAATDAARVEQIQKATTAWAVAGGTADAITASFTPTLTAIAAGSLVRVRAGAANATTTPTFNPDSLGAETITKNGGQALVAGDIFGANHELLLQKKTTGYELLNPSVRTSSDTVAGLVELATTAETATGTDATRAVTPAGLAAAAHDFDGNIAMNGTLTLNGATSVSALLDAQEDIRWSGDISPTQITADQNDYAPTGHATASVFRLTSDAARTLTGLSGGADGRVVKLLNLNTTAGHTISLANENASSTAANRFSVGIAYAIQPYRGVTLWYDSTSSRWRISEFGAVPADAIFMEAAAADTVYVTPVIQHHHPGHPKASLVWDGAAGSNLADYGITSVSDDGAGLWTPTFDTAFSAATTYGFTHGHNDAANLTGQYIKALATITTTTMPHRSNSNGAVDDYTQSFTSYYGDQ